MNTHLNVKPLRVNSANNLEAVESEILLSDVPILVCGLPHHGHIHVPELEEAL